MIDDLGLKGLSAGDARVSDRHANFFVNAGKATAKDMLMLISDVRERVRSALVSNWNTSWSFGTHEDISRGATAADAEAYRPELLGEEEPRYLRRQKPVEIRRKKFSGRSWSFYRRVLFFGVVGIAGRVGGGGLAAGFCCMRRRCSW